MTEQTAAPTGIHLHRKSRILELTWADGSSHRLPCEYLRVYSPSAEVKGHGPGQEVLQTGKQHVNISAIKPVGHYALQLVFDDGHDTGLYGWGYLRELCEEQGPRWDDYLRRLHAAGASRDPQVQVVKFQP